MDDFIPLQNIKRFRAQLEDCADAHLRKTLEGLLAEEEAKLKVLKGPKP